MKILLTGASGLLGQDVWKVFTPHHDVLGLGRAKPAWILSSQWRPADLLDGRQAYTIVTKENPDLVIHCAAYNDVDGAEKDPEAAFKLNALGTRNLALACQRFDTILMAISTDYVFDGINPPPQGYREFDTLHPLNVYAESKRWGEIYIQQLINKYFIVRTSWLFGPGRPTFADKVVARARENKPVAAVRDMVGSPTYTPDLAKALYQLAQSERYGIYHLTSGGSCSRLELVTEVLRLHNMTDYRNVNPLLQSELKLLARRPIFSALENFVWRMDGFPALRSWKDALKEHVMKSQVTSR